MRQDHAELVEAARRGDRDAMGALIEQELPWIRGVVAGYIGARDAVDDICQDVFVSAWQSIGSLRKAAGFRPWLYRIAVNKVRSFIRRSRRNPVVSLPDVVEAHRAIDEVGAYGAVDSETKEDLSDALGAALKKLAPEYRDPLVIHYLQGKSCAETAAILGLRPVTARIRLLRGRERLREILQKDGAL